MPNQIHHNKFKMCQAWIQRPSHVTQTTHIIISTKYKIFLYYINLYHKETHGIKIDGTILLYFHSRLLQ